VLEIDTTEVEAEAGRSSTATARAGFSIPPRLAVSAKCRPAWLGPRGVCAEWCRCGKLSGLPTIPSCRCFIDSGK